MAAVKTLTLVAPNLPRLLGPTAAARPATLQRFCRRAESAFLAEMSLSAWYCRRFGVARQADWPVAPLLAAAAGHATGYWLCADPASLAADRDRVLLMPPPELSDTESRELFALLRAHVEADGIRALWIDAGRWCLGVERAPDLRCGDPALATGRDAGRYMPAGADAAPWLRLLTEVQMLLHDHAVNQGREARGEPAVNSLWLWGGGTLPIAGPVDFAVACGTDALLRALAQRAGAAQLALGASAAETLERHAHGSLLIAPDAALPMHDADTSAWVRDWLDPAWAALGAGLIDAVVLVGPLAGGVAEIRLARSARWKFWRRREPTPLGENASS